MESDKNPAASSYALIDAGNDRRLERLGSLVVDRPAGAAAGARRAPGSWREADLRFEPGSGWHSPSGRVDAHDAWQASVTGLTLELRPTASGGVGLYPEHVANLAWLSERMAVQRIAAGQAGSDRPHVLNLFAHTGLATLGLARAGAGVAHVDAARSAVVWARRNAELSGLADRPVRWLVDDATGFVEREVRRGRRYDGIVLDPPSSGLAPTAGAGGRRRWTLDQDLERLLAACAAVAAAGAFVLLTAHTTGLDPELLADLVGATFGGRAPEIIPLHLDAESGARLELGWAVRLDPLDGAP
jgi:23S rRNA (cytosine1962-C5)-methyltransferase